MKSEVFMTESELPSEVLRAIEKGHKIEAIKILREKSGLGLANAKVLVDRAASRLTPLSSNPAMLREESASSKLMKSLLLVTALAALYYFAIGI